MMFKLSIALLATLLAIAAAEVNITLSADGTYFEASEYADDSIERIINGHPARAGQFPWQATVFVQLVQNQWNFVSGALISRNWVVVAASGVRGSRETRVLLGSNNFGRGQQIFSHQTIVHPRFGKTGSRLFDIAVINLLQPVTIGGSIRPVPIARQGHQWTRQYASISGFGSTGK